MMAENENRLSDHTRVNEDPAMTHDDLDAQLVAYQLNPSIKMRLAAAASGRDWMNTSNSGFANRCLPMRIANQAGWVVLNDQPLRTQWLGGSDPGSVIVEYAGDPPHAAVGHFGEGILTFRIPFLFRTPPGISLLFRGPANLPKDAIAPLEGLVETDWAIAAASVNWKFTRANTWVEFQKDEPVCMIVPQKLAQLESYQPRVVKIADDSELSRNYQHWRRSVAEFTERLRERDPLAIQQGWQKFYFRGTAPHMQSTTTACQVGDHRLKLDLQEFVVKEGSPSS
jgi:hypothetical protein